MTIWILNRKKFKSFSFAISILVYTVNMALIRTCIRFFDCIFAGMKMDWYQTSVQFAEEQDVFFMDKAETILITLMLVFSFVTVFSILVVLGYRKMQLIGELSETALFLIQGYKKTLLWKALTEEGTADLIISLPFSLLLSEIIVQNLCQDSMFRLILTFTGHNTGNAVFYTLFPCVLLTAVFMIQTAWYLKSNCRRGFMQMLRGV